MNKIVNPKELQKSTKAKPVSMLERLPNMSEDARKNVKAMLSFKGPKNWDGLNVIPHGTFLEEVIELFRSETDIPLELPLAMVVSMVSGYLNSVQAKYEIGGVLMPARLWIVVLASSGAGKTFTTSTIANWLTDQAGEKVVPEIQCASSAAQFAANLEQTSRGLMVRDEFGQYLSQIQNLRHMEETKDMLLQGYSGAPIERLTKENQISIKDHAISILGITVEETFEKQLGEDSLVDGFAQRFNYLVASPDENRRFEDNPLYFEKIKTTEQQQRLAKLKASWRCIINRNDLPMAEFDFDMEAIELFKHSFKSLFKEGEIPQSFFRRAMFSVFSYAVVFHVIAGNLGTTIGKDSVGFAVRMVALHLNSARKLLDGYGLSTLEKTVRKAE